ncbi:MAG: hypothetical protein V1840_04770 [Candidatus Omnitrophota bacterium]
MNSMHEKNERKNARMFFVLGLAGLLLLGCAHLSETAKKVWGSSITHLEAARASGHKEVFAYSPEACFKIAEEALLKRGALVYLKDKDKRYLAAMNFKGYVDTTEAGVFFTKLSDGKTLVEVASMSPRLAREAAGYVFSGMK